MSNIKLLRKKVCPKCGYVPLRIYTTTKFFNGTYVYNFICMNCSSDGKEDDLLTLSEYRNNKINDILE